MMRNKIIKRYKIGQVVNMRIRGSDGKNIIDKFKATIIRFYPYHVHCKVNGHNECFTYADFDRNTRNKGVSR